MAVSKDENDVGLPEVILNLPTLAPNSTAEPHKPTEASPKIEVVVEGSLPRNRHIFRSQSEKHVRLNDPSGVERQPVSSSSSIYMGSFSRSPRHSRGSLGDSARTPSPRASMGQGQLEHLLQNMDVDLDTYSVEELRDGFFDALFFKPPTDDQENLLKLAEFTLPSNFEKRNPLSPSQFLPKQWHELKGVIRRVTTTRAGMKLIKTFLGFFIAYVMCLIPVTGNWLGRYNYIMVLSAIINHPGRTVGSQIDGAVLTILGTASGLGWGAFALYVSDSSSIAASGYGGVLAAFLVVFMGMISALRSYFIRLYQLVLCAGIAIIYTCLSETSRTVDWPKLLDYGIPWLLGQALCLLICCAFFPDAGSRPLAVALHDAFCCMNDSLNIPHLDKISCHRQLAWTFVNLSQAHRDLVLDISITRFHPNDIQDLRNLMQAVIRSLLALKTETNFFDDLESRESASSERNDADSVVDIDPTQARPILPKTKTAKAVQLVQNKLSEPTQALLALIKESLSRCDAVLLTMSGYRKHIGPPTTVSSDILDSLINLRKAMIKFDEEDDALMEHPQLPPTYSDHPEIVELFLFVNPIRQAANSAELLLVKVMGMQQRRRGWRPYWPSYSFTKGLQRTNAQVRHDRGGVTAGFYFKSQRELNKIMQEIQKNTYRPMTRQRDGKVDKTRKEDYTEEEAVLMDRDTAGKKALRYKFWTVLHRLQGFETRFALKVAIVTSLLSVPAWLDQSRVWYNSYQSWWAVVMVWVMMHPRVGGNFQDLVTRSLMGVLGALWGGFAYAAGNGNRYVMAVFATIFMIPMIYRYTQSSHPRSGIVGCISFTVVSLNALALRGRPSIVIISWTYGVAFVVGVISAVVVNWILWPFVARHELRKAISAMLLHSAIIYRGVVAQYIYYEDGSEPGQDIVARSELLEGRLREGFVRIRQLMALTRHEIRLRAPFDPLPYSALIENCESFFEHLVEVRQSSLFFHPNYLSGNEAASAELLPFRRDAVACILMNLYILAGALRGDRRVPRYLPSAAVARKRLLDRMAEVEIEHAHVRGSQIVVPKRGVGRKFAEVYQFAYSQALTACVEQLEQLQRYTKIICGEFGFDPIDDTEYEESSKKKKAMHGSGGN